LAPHYFVKDNTEYIAGQWFSKEEAAHVGLLLVVQMDNLWLSI
jgi:hypothetical protein